MGFAAGVFIVRIILTFIDFKALPEIGQKEIMALEGEPRANERIRSDQIEYRHDKIEHEL